MHQAVARVVQALGCVLLLALISACRGGPAQVPACAEGARRCAEGARIERCEKRAWVLEQRCPFDQGCDVGESRAPLECRALPEAPFKPERLLSGPAVMSAPPAGLSPNRHVRACRMLSALFEEYQPGPEPRIVPTGERQGSDGLERVGLARCAFGLLIEAMGQAADKAGAKPPWERARLTLDETTDRAVYRLYLKEDESVRPPPGREPEVLADLEMNTDGSRPALAGLKNFSFVTFDLDFWTDITLRFPAAAMNAGLAQAAQTISDKLRFALTAFYRTGKFARAREAATDPRVLARIAQTYPLLERHPEWFTCSGECLPALKAFDARLHAFARLRPLSPQGEFNLEDALHDLLPKAAPAIVALTLAKPISEAGRLDPLIAPDHRMDLDKWFFLWRHALTPEVYAEILVTTALCAPPDFPYLVEGLVWADPAALRRQVVPHLSEVWSPALERILPYWIRADTPEAVKELAALYGAKQLKENERTVIVDLLADNTQGQNAAISFLMERLERDEITLEGLKRLLANPTAAKRVVDWLGEHLEALAPTLQRAVLEFVQSRLAEPEKGPLALMPAIRRLARKSGDFRVFRLARETAARFESPNWRGAGHPRAVERYLDPSAGTPPNETLKVAALSTLESADEGVFWDLFDTSLSLTPEQQSLLGDLLAQAGAHNRALKPVAERAARFKEPPALSAFARRVLMRMERGR